MDVVSCGEYEDQKYGFEVPLELVLSKVKSEQPSKEVAYFRFYEETGYIDYRLDSNLINQE